MATPKQSQALVSHFIKRYKEKYGANPNVNRYSARYGFDALLFDMDDEQAKELIDYYFETASANSHALPWFFNNYDKLQDAMVKKAEDDELRCRLREESKARTEQWRNKIRESGLESS